MRGAGIIGIVAGCAMLVASGVTVHGQVQAASARLKTGVAAAGGPARAMRNDGGGARRQAAF